tara:strand:+ start:76 stop:771 length:696 start_codon:yes stop_codon:yes gene_type:complete
MTDTNTNNLSGEIVAALSKAQARLGGAVAKDARNPHFRSEYVTLGAVLKAAIPALTSEGIALVQYRDGAELVTLLGHVDGGRLEVRYPLQPTKNDAQGWGSAITYARRYQLMSLLGLAGEDDDGNAASGLDAAPAPRRAPAQKKANKSSRGAKKAADSTSSDDWSTRAAESIAAAAAVLDVDSLAAILGCELGDVEEAIGVENLRAIGRDNSRKLLEALRQAGREILGSNR